MTKIMFFGAILFFSVAAIAQSNSIDKSAISGIETGEVEISVVAIPFDRINNTEIDPENYHKTITIGDSTGYPEQAAEITIPAIKYNDGILSTGKKEVLKSGDSGMRGNATENQKTVEVKAAATKR